MQDHEPITVENIWPRDLAGSPLPSQPARLWDFFSRDRDEVLMLRDTYADRSRTILLSTLALAASFGLGWAGGLSWPEFAGTFGLGPVAQNEAPSPRIAEAKPVGKVEGARRTASAPDSQINAPAVTGSIPKPSAASAGGARVAVGSASLATPSPDAAIAMRPPLAAAPETKPTTIPGWRVIDVRDGTAVLEGPDGIRMAARGDAIPGLGRVDSIVRWGNRWIVATANGLIATQ
jgi:hypothetical protein